jgi:hypothetical protein
VKLFGSVHNKHFCLLKQKFLLKIGCSGIENCNTFLEVPSIINENVKKRAVPLANPKLIFLNFIEDFSTYAGADQNKKVFQIYIFLKFRVCPIMTLPKVII